MNIAIFSRDPALYSTQSLQRAASARGHFVQVIDHLCCSLWLEDTRPTVYYNGQHLNYLDAIIPRIGASVTQAGAALISQFESMDVFSTTHAAALLLTRDKLRSLQQLMRCGVPVPRTMLPGEAQQLDDLIESLGGFPVVIKLLEGTHGVGVLLAHNLLQATSIIETFQKIGQRILLQEFIAEAAGADLRAFVVHGEVVAAMRRQAKPGEFRSNLHRGGSAVPVTLSEAEAEIAVQAAWAMGLDIAGVDILCSRRGPLVMEVNASPGLEGIENATQIDVASSIISFVESHVAILQPIRV
jgi:ribosomal protein S6--L-glutamate ligase